MTTQDPTAPDAGINAWLVAQMERAAQDQALASPSDLDDSWLTGWVYLSPAARHRLENEGWHSGHAQRLAPLYPGMSPLEWTVIFETCSFARFGTLDPDLVYVWLCATSDENGPLPLEEIEPVEVFQQVGALGAYAWAAGLPREHFEGRDADGFPFGALRAAAALRGRTMPPWPLPEVTPVPVPEPVLETVEAVLVPDATAEFVPDFTGEDAEHLPTQQTAAVRANLGASLPTLEQTAVERRRRLPPVPLGRFEDTGQSARVPAHA